MIKSNEAKNNFFTNGYNKKFTQTDQLNKSDMKQIQSSYFFPRILSQYQNLLKIKTKKKITLKKIPNINNKLINTTHQHNTYIHI